MPISLTRGRIEAPRANLEDPGRFDRSQHFHERDSEAAEQQRRATPPIIASTRHSVRIWRTTRPRLAPMAHRTAISRCRALPRASSRFATLAQTIRRTTATAARNSCSAGRTSLTARSLRRCTSKRGTARAGAFAGGGGVSAVPMTSGLLEGGVKCHARPHAADQRHPGAFGHRRRRLACRSQPRRRETRTPPAERRRPSAAVAATNRCHELDRFSDDSGIGVEDRRHVSKPSTRTFGSASSAGTRMRPSLARTPSDRERTR